MTLFDLSELIDAICYKIIYFFIIFILFEKLRVIATRYYDAWLEDLPCEKELLISKLESQIIKKDVEIKRLQAKIRPLNIKDML